MNTDELQHAQAEADKWRRMARKHEARDRFHYRTLVSLQAKLTNALDLIDDDLEKTSRIRMTREDDK
jgi:hypothetical protein